MMVRQMMRLGRDSSALAAEMACSTSVTESPSIGPVTCHPKDGEAASNVFSEREARASFDGDGVRVIQHDESPKGQVSGKRRSFARQSLHEVAVRYDAVGVVVDHR